MQWNKMLFSKLFFVAVSTPPTSSPGPPTTEAYRDMWDNRNEINNSLSGHQNSYSVRMIDKSKMQQLFCCFYDVTAGDY
jgi:hypothetical protein